MRRFRRIGLSSCQRFQQAPCALMLPLVGKVGPLKGHGVGLTPAPLSSVEPIGIVPMPRSALELGGVPLGDNVPGLLEPVA
jgi:hypothetical protein